jgi:hypothetical protein
MAMTESGWTEEPPDVAKAMQQAAAVLRWLSDNAPTHDYSEFIEYAWTSADLDALADELTREQRDVIADPGT